MKFKKSQNGFTLLELVIVLAVLAILSGVLVPMVKQMIDRSRTAKILAMIDTLETACKRFTKDNRGDASTQTVLESGNPADIAVDQHRLYYGPVAGNGTGYTPTNYPSWGGPYLSDPLNNNSLPFTGGTVVVSRSIDGCAGAAGYQLVSTLFTSSTTNPRGGYELVLTGVPLRWKTDIEMALDGADDADDGKVEWAGSDPYTLRIFLLTR